MWIRVDVGTGRAETTLSLAAALAISTAQAVGHRTLLEAAIAYSRPDGYVGDVSARMVEMWAMWNGEPETFGRYVLEAMVDEDGRLEGWEETIGPQLKRRSSDAERQRRLRARRASERLNQATVTPIVTPDVTRDMVVTSRPENIAAQGVLHVEKHENTPTNTEYMAVTRDVGVTTPNVTLPSRVTVTGPQSLEHREQRTENREQTVVCSLEEEPGESPTNAFGNQPSTSEYTLALVIQANKGQMAGHGEPHRPLGHGYPPNLEVSERLLEAKVPLDFATPIVYNMAKSYVPESLGACISTLKYFENPIMHAWRKQMALDAARRAEPAGSGNTVEVRGDRGTDTAKRPTPGRSGTDYNAAKVERTGDAAKDAYSLLTPFSRRSA